MSRGLSCGTGGPPGLPAAIGIEQARDIHYRALTTYLTRHATFRQTRAALRRAALDLYGQATAAVVDAAYDLVGVQRDNGSTPRCNADFATACT